MRAYIASLHALLHLLEILYEVGDGDLGQHDKVNYSLFTARAALQSWKGFRGSW